MPQPRQIRSVLRWILAICSLIACTSCGGGGAPTLPLDPGNELRVGLRVVLITDEGQTPLLWPGLDNWSEGAVATWVDRHLNTVFAPAHIRIPPEAVRLTRRDAPGYFRLETRAKIDAFEDFISTQVDPTVLNLFVVDLCTADNIGGEATDFGCDPDNTGRAAWVMPLSSLPGQRKLVAHELGHVMNLPHIRTTLPITASNHNLMSYETYSPELSTAIEREVPDAETPCYWYQPKAMNQHQVMRDWVRQYLPEINERIAE